ncbi:MAG: hypothetical protein KDE53_25180, partial [Caldilineaceae bacterium]|nr:hypothetical protein [Caldilineaceae bacterium]
MATSLPWSPAEPDLQAVLAAHPDPLRALAGAEMPAIVLRQAYDPAQCMPLLQRFTDWGLMRDPKATTADQRNRIDIGTSLGNRGQDKERFLAHAVATQALFRILFTGFDDPVQCMYNALQQLAGEKTVKVAQEPDGRQYGPAIFRIHYDSHAYKPHIDHVTLRERRFDYAVSRFEHQFAGILCLQNASQQGHAAQTIIHQCLWTEAIQPHIANETFHEYAAANGLGSYKIALAPGDLYFFNTRCIHEIPAIEGDDPRAVLAVFIGYSEDD